MRLLIIVLLAAVALMSTAERARSNDGIDFFNFWGVPAALRLADHGLGSPYREGAEYLTLLKAHAAAADDPKLASAAQAWAAPDFTATPLLYTVFATFPRDYAASIGVFQLLQVVVFILTCLLLGRKYGLDYTVSFALALVLLLSYQPLLADLRVANLGCLQFGILGGTVVASHRLLPAEDRSRRVALGGLLLMALVGLTLIKPNVALITGLLAMHVVARVGRRGIAIVVIPVAAVTVALIVAPCVYFGSWHVWTDWYQFVYGSNAQMLVRTVRDGNYSTVVVLASLLDADVFRTSLGALALLGASLLTTTWWTTGTSRQSRSLKEAAKRITRHIGASGEFALTLGAAATLAVSPLVWLHYFLLAVIPCVWLAATPFTSKHPARLAVIAIVLSSAAPGMLLSQAGMPEGMAATIAASWIPLWAAVIILAATNPSGPPIAESVVPQ
jgi:hypothetical protein